MSAARRRHVYFFGAGQADGAAAMRDVLGGKGAGLAEMTRIGAPVPPGFTISAALCAAYLESGAFPDGLEDEVRAAMTRLEEVTGKRFGDPEHPLLVSVRSGAAVSMPGMMETILNLGLNETTVRGLAQQSGNPRFAHDAHRRFVAMYGAVVFGVPKGVFESLLEERKRQRGVERDIDLPAGDLEALAAEYERCLSEDTGYEFPQDPWKQLWGAIAAVYRSWNTRRAADYRRVRGISDRLGTAVNVVTMVFGNMGDDSATGVAFTRDPATGEKRLYGEFLVNAQGEDVVAGIRDPEPIDGLAERLPDAHRQLEELAGVLERHYGDVQDLEFTIERGTLYLLQTRRAQRSGAAAVRIAVEMVDAELIDEREAIQRVPAGDLDQLLHPTVDPKAAVDVLTTGLPASPGAAVGRAVFDADVAAERGGQGEAVILVRPETSPDDFHGMVAAQAIVTARGGMTSHAAVVARGMGKACVAGAKEIEVDAAHSRFRCNGRVVQEGDWITADGSTGRVILGRVPLVEPEMTGNFARLMAWADAVRRLRVRANADTPADARRAREFGAQGIGLCRTEHMFFEGNRIATMREMIVAPDAEGRRRALAKLLPMQRDDFVGIFEAMDGLPVTIRLLDPPLHEFLPREGDEIESLAGTMAVDPGELRRLIERLSETNPMLGHRGCRLGIVFPEITEMQARAIFEAACRVSRGGRDVLPEIMVPLVAHVEELRRQAEIVRRVARDVFNAEGTEVRYLVGTMIEVPRAALTAGAVAREADFFSFGTNDLTQMVFGVSRDDAGRFLPVYIADGILSADPFQVLDTEGVGQLVESATRMGRSARADLKVGICGEHGGDPESVRFFHNVGLDYVSCSPFRLPIARLAAAQASLEEQGVESEARATV